MKIITCFFLLSFVFFPNGYAQNDEQAPAQSSNQESGYRLEKPGVVVFDIGTKIKGKVNKPQVMIFLPKEKSQYQEFTFSHSFSEFILKPLPFIPITE